MTIGCKKPVICSNLRFAVAKVLLCSSGSVSGRRETVKKHVSQARRTQASLSLTATKSAQDPVDPTRSEREASKSPAPPVLHRTFFPETWLWDLHIIGSSGKQEVQVTLPHTITEWIGNGFCVGHNSGLGISSPFSITAFQPFFLTFTLPYSMIRGEKVSVPISVFNYLSECLEVTISVEKSSSFQLVNRTRETQLRVCGRETGVRSFTIVPKQLGKINFTVSASSVPSNDWSQTNSVYTREQTTASDMITRELLVEAEGIEEEMTKSAFICGKASGEWDFSLPTDLVDNSSRAHVSVIGDVMGPALSGLDSLLRMPMGCGEQNMLLFSPNIFVLQYLNKTRRLTPAIQEKALKFMQIGYQRELTYRHEDGSYSAFGKSDPAGSIWLTAFVIKSFAQAKPYMFIDDKDLRVSIDWIISRQLENGCFPQIGTVHHKEMKGRVGDSTISLTAYILISLLETGIDVKLPVITNALRCLHTQSIADTYTLSLVAYAETTISNKTTDSRTSQQLRGIIATINSRAVVKDGLKHWTSSSEAAGVDDDDSYGVYHTSPANVETTAYVLLSLISGRDVWSVLPQAQPVVRWLSAQRNANGGFASTQDTVLALQALALYAGLVHRDDINLHIVINSKKVDHVFDITQDNSLLLQKRERLPAHKKVMYNMTGVGCALIQASVKYNRLGLISDQPAQKPSFILTANVIQSSKICAQRSINICARYNGTDSASNMAVIAVKMVSGWIPEKSSVYKLKNQARLGLKRSEIDKNTIQLYFDELDKTDRCFVIVVEQEQQVADTKPALIHVYDYYAPSVSTFVQYNLSTCAQEQQQQEVRRSRKPNQKKTTAAPRRNQPPANRNNKNCPICTATTMSLLCQAQFVYKVRVGLNGSVEILSVIKFSATSSQPRSTSNFKIILPPKCTCTTLQTGIIEHLDQVSNDAIFLGSVVVIGSPMKFKKIDNDWVLNLKAGSTVATTTTTTRDSDICAMFNFL